MNDSPPSNGRRRSIPRRSFIAGATGLSLPVLAGCTGGGNGGSDNDEGESTDGESTAEPQAVESGEVTSESGDETGELGPGEPTAQLFDEDIPESPSFIANPNIDGPGGDAELIVPLGISNRGDEDAFETFVIRIEEVVLEDAGGGTVAAPIDVELDLTAYEYGGMGRGDTITVGWRLEIPAAHYTTADFECSPVEIVHESDGDVTDLFDPAGSYPLGNDGEGVEVEADVIFRPLPDFRVTYEPWDDQLGFGPERDDIGIHTVPSTHFDPTEYGA